MDFPAGELREGLTLAAGGIRVAEYDDTTALLENDGRTLRVTRSDDHAACVAEKPLGADGEGLLECEGQLELRMGVAEMLLPPTPTVEPGEPDQQADGSGGGVHVDALLMERVLAAAGNGNPGAAIEITATADGQKMTTNAGTYHTLIPPPRKKLRTPDTLPFGAARLSHVPEAVKATAAYAGTRKNGTDQIVITVTAGEEVWLSRGSAEHPAVAGRKLDGTPPVPAGRRLLLRGELAPLLSRMDASGEFLVWVDTAGMIRGEMPTRGWDVRYAAPPDLTGSLTPPRLEDWLEAETTLSCVVEAGRYASAVASACAMAGYAPPTASTRDMSPIATPYEGAGDVKPAPRELLRLAFGADDAGVVVAGHGWRYDRTATPVRYLTPPPPGQITGCFAAEQGEITVEPKLAASAAAAAGRSGGLVSLSLRETGNVTALVVQPCEQPLVFVMPINPDIGDDLS